MLRNAPGWDSGELVRRIEAAGLRGRGGGWFPAWRKWRAVRAEGGDAVVIANGAEGEPGSIKDRYAMVAWPAEVLSGLALAARAVGAREAHVYLKGSFERPARALQGALGRVATKDLELTVHRGEDSYVAGEETALLESLEGKRAWPRPKPPLPAGVGLHGRPTLVQNVETLARVPAAVADPDGYRRDETTLVSLWGHVRKPGVYEVALGTPLVQVIEQHGEGAPDGVGLVFPAGPSAAPLPAAALATPLDPDALRAAGSGLGTASILVIGRSKCPLAVAASLAAFFAREACGQCPPCMLGTASLSRITRNAEDGAARSSELRALHEAAGFMAMHGYCAHARTAAAAVTGVLALARGDLAAHAEAGRCPRPEGGCDPFDPGSPERAAVEAALETGDA